jgi:hypothetical protein
MQTLSWKTLRKKWTGPLFLCILPYFSINNCKLQNRKLYWSIKYIIIIFSYLIE